MKYKEAELTDFLDFAPTLNAERLVLNSKFDSTLDFFQTRIGGMHISEGLKEAIEILGFTGVNIFDDKEPLIVIQ